MFKMTKGDLAKKTNVQLAALFQDTSKGLIIAPTDIAPTDIAPTDIAPSDIASARLLLAMIRAEMARRAPSP